MEALKFKPILFSPEMVQAILAENKTMTRRIIKDKRLKENDFELTRIWDGYGKFCEKHNWTNEIYIRCPFPPGTIMWVKEFHYRYGKWEKNGFNEKGRQKWKFKAAPVSTEFYEPFYAGEIDLSTVKKNSYRKLGWYKRPSLFMPRSCARIFLKVEDTTAEKLQDMCQEDAKAEGITDRAPHRCPGWKNELLSFADCYICPFKMLWNRINGAKGSGWDTNPPVWVIKFTKIDKMELTQQVKIESAAGKVQKEPV